MTAFLNFAKNINIIVIKITAIIRHFITTHGSEMNGKAAPLLLRLLFLKSVYVLYHFAEYYCYN